MTSVVETSATVDNLRRLARNQIDLGLVTTKTGFANVVSDKQDYSEILDGLGRRWEATLNSYNSFACGIVIHPTIDGCQQIGRKTCDRVGEIRRVKLTAHPLVLELTGKTAPKTGLQGKVQHLSRCCLRITAG